MQEGKSKSWGIPLNLHLFWGYKVLLSITCSVRLQEFACNGTLVDDEEAGKVIQLQGDQRKNIAAFLVEEGIPKNLIKVHGF